MGLLTSTKTYGLLNTAGALSAPSLTSFNTPMAQSTQAIPTSTTPNINPIDILKSTGQAIARTVGSVGITAGNLPTQIVNNSLFVKKYGLLSQQPLPFDQSISTTGNKFTSALFGGQPVNTIGKNISNLQTGLEPYLGKTVAKFSAPPLILGSIALDLSGFGGGSAVDVASKNIPEAFFKTMAEHDSPEAITSLLKGTGMTDAHIAELAPQFARATTVDEAKNVLLEFSNNNKTPIAERIAKSKDSTEIANILQNTGVDKNQIPQMSEVLARIDNPRKVNTIIEGFDTTRTPKLGTQPTPSIDNMAIVPTQEATPLPQLPNAQIPIEQGEVKSIEIQAQQAHSIANGEEIPSGVSLPHIISQTITPVQSKVHLIDTYLRTPDRVMQKIGFGQDAKDLRTAMDSYWKELPKNINKISEWAKEVPKESNARIFKYLDGQAITLRPDEQKVATEIKTWLTEWAERLGLKNDNRISDYITHIFDKESQKEFDEELAKVISDKIPGSVYNPFTLKRLGARGYLQDTWKALDAYVKRSTRKVHLDPVLEQIQSKAGSSLEFSNIEKSQWQYIKKYIDNINMRPSDLDESIDNVVKSMFGNKFGQRPITTITKFLRKATFRGMLGLNLSSALRNLSQGVNTYAALGEKYTVLGYANLLKKGAFDELRDSGVLNAGFIQDKSLSATKQALQKLDSGLFVFFDTAEKINRGSAYFGAKAKALGLGKSEEEAVNYAKETVRKTQFSFDSVDTPVGMQGDIMKTLFQFQSFTTKQIEFLTEMAKDKNFVGLLRYAIGGLIFAYTIGKAFGMDKKELLPWYRFDVPASLKAPVTVAGALLNSPNQYGQQRSTGQKIKDVGDSLVGLVPAGSQIKKTVQGYNAIQKGASTDSAGRRQFPVGGTVAKDAQALAFGKYAGQDAKDYFNGDTFAEQKYQELLKSKTGKADFQKIIETDPTLAKAILKVKEKIDLGITPDDENLLKLNNEPRAEALIKEFNKLKTKEEKASLWQNYVTKKVITPDVADKMKTLLQKPQTKKTSFLQSIFGAKVAEAESVPKQVDQVEKTAQGLAYNETRGVKNPYTFSQPSGNKALGRALGKYQVTEADLKRLSPRYLGRTVTAKEFLASSVLQEKFIKNRIAYQLSQGYSPEQIADIHRSGTGGILSPEKYVLKHPEYVKTFKQATSS